MPIKYDRSVISRLEVILADTTDRTMPVRRQVFERHLVVLGGLVNPAADLAYIFLVHRLSLSIAFTSGRSNHPVKSAFRFDGAYYELFIQ